MDVVSILFVFVLGTLVGSFLNVVILRYNTGMSSATGRSVCFQCNSRIHWYDMVPVFSFLLLTGKCRSCKSKLSIQYPLVEFFTGVLFVLLYMRQLSLLPVYSVFGNPDVYALIFFIYYAVVFSLLSVIFVYDMRHKIIPDVFVYTFVVLSLCKLLFYIYCMGFVFNTQMILHVASPFILSLPFAFLWYISEGKWIGLGDAKLMFGMGAFLGFGLGISAITIAFWVGALWGVGMIILSRVSPRIHTAHFSTEVPFAPFLILATVYVFFTHVDIFGISHLLGL